MSNDPIWSIPPDLERHGLLKTLAPGSWDITADLEAFIEKTGGGEGVAIGNGDTGIRESHEEFGDAFKGAKDFTRSRNGYRDINGHGTWCCGKNVGKKLGIARKSHLYVAKVLGDSGSGSSDGILRGVQWLIEQGCQVISLSLGSSMPYEPMGRFIQEKSTKDGIVFCCAAGNAGYNGRSTIGWPAKNKHAISVAAYGRNGNPASFSSGGDKLELSGPGVQTVAASSRGDSSYEAMSGTSMSTPWIAGVIACLLSYAYGKGYAHVKGIDAWHAIFQAIADDAGEPGKDVRFGFGKVNFDKILEHFDLKLKA